MLHSSIACMQGTITGVRTCQYILAWKVSNAESRQNVVL